MSLVVVGSVAYDSVRTPFGARDDQLGGSATYFSLAARLWSRPRLVAVVGDDFRDADLDLLERHGVDTEGLQRAPGGTFRWGGVYHDDMIGRDTLYTELNVFETFRPELPETYRDASHVFLGNIHPALQSLVLDQVRAPAFVAVDTMNFWITGARDMLVEVLGRVDAIFLNDEEATQLTGQRSMVRAARAIQALGPRAVVIKRGEHGALLFAEDDVFFAPGFPLEEVHDPTGAGDSFGGGFMGYLASRSDTSSRTLRQAVVVGSVVASFSVQGFGVDPLCTLSREQLTERCGAFAALTAFADPDI